MGRGIRAQQVARLNGIPPRSQAGQLFRQLCHLAGSQKANAPQVDTQDRLALGKAVMGDAQQCAIPANGDNLFCLGQRLLLGQEYRLGIHQFPSQLIRQQGMDAVLIQQSDHLTGNGKIGIFDSVWKKEKRTSSFPLSGYGFKVTGTQLLRFSVGWGFIQRRVGVGNRLFDQTFRQRLRILAVLDIHQKFNVALRPLNGRKNPVPPG